jgi:DNA-binding transcriptional LysR family regulator
MKQHLDLNSLILFYEVVNARSITRASENLRIPKPTISRKLGILEREVGGTLLKRGHMFLVPTEMGAVLYSHCSRLVTEIQTAGIITAKLQNELRGTLRVSIPIDFGISWISRTLAEFILKYSEIQLEVEVNSRLVNPRDDPYDLTIQLGPLKESGLTYRRLATITRGVYASPIYLARKGMPHDIGDFAEHDCIVTEQQRQDGTWHFVQTGDNSTHRPITVEGKVVVNNIGIARELAIGGVGLGMLPNIMCKNDVKANRLVRILNDWQGPSMHATALILSRKGIPNKTRAFLDFLGDRLMDEANEVASLVQAG